MNNVNQQDLILYRNCRRRVERRLLITLLFLIAYSVGVAYALNTAFLKVDANGFDVLLSGILLSQVGIYMVIFILLTTGSKIYRYIYWVAFALSVAMLYVPISTAITDMGHLLSYLVLLVCMIVKLQVLWSTGDYLKNNPSSKVFFDHIVEVDENDNFEDPRFAKDLAKQQKKTISQLNMGEDDTVQVVDMEQPQVELPHQEIDDEVSEALVETLTYQKLAVRIGIVVYSSLGLFPILIQIFHSLFASNDYQYIFANHDMFVSCLISAILWTIPVLFMYYEHPRSKQLVKACILGELIRIACYLPTFIGYIRAEDTTYPVRTFIFYIAFDVVRYLLLGMTIRPIFKMDPPEPKNDDDEYDNDDEQEGAE